MAQTTTSTTVHEIIKYSSSKTSLPAQVGSGEIQWKHHSGEQLRLALDITTTRNPAGGASLARYVMKISYLSDEPPETLYESQNAVPEVVLEKLDLSSFSDIRYYGRELPLKAVYKNSTVAFRYLHPLIQSGTSVQTYRRFQMTFKSEIEAFEFIQSIQLICPCDKSRSNQPTATQATPSSQRQPTQRPAASKDQPTFSQPLHPTVSKTAYRKSAMFADGLTSSSFSDRASSPDFSSSPILPVQRRLASSPSILDHEIAEATDSAARGSASNRMDIDDISSTQQRHAKDGNSRSSLPSSAASPLSSQPVQAPIDAPTGGAVGGSSKRPAVPTAQHTPATGDRPDTGPILSALREGDADIYKLSFEELRQMVGEVIREPGFPEL
ncbi:hypothetical protein FRC07_013013, partial [Ceratobasidium sp. 392]